MTEEVQSTETVAAKGKSIIDPKYRGRYKTPDWLAQLLTDNASIRKTVAAKPAQEQVGKIGEEGYKPAKDATPEKVVNDGVDVDALFKIAGDNGLSARVEKFQTQRASHGFDGRFRMTVRNMLQKVVKERHGLNVNGSFVSAPAEFLQKIGVVGDAPATHTQDGKIAKAPTKAEVAAAEGDATTGEPESKLIKGDKPAKAKAKK